MGNMMSIICPECKKENDDGAEFCKNCGINLTERENISPAPERRISKTLIISAAVFILFFAWSFSDFITHPKYSHMNVFSSLMASTFVGLFVFVPTYAIGYMIRRFKSK